MNEDHKHIDQIFSGTEIPWKKTKAEIWKDLEKGLEKENRIREPFRRTLPNRQWYALAASLALLLSIGSFMKFYTVQTVCPPGVHTSLNLPGGSVVEINAATSVEYHPYWWFLSRKVSLEGEAFFLVEKGKKFRVISDAGTTEVLGTTFNVFARGEHYQVTCHTGRVRVSDAISDQSVILSPNEQAELSESGSFAVSTLDAQGQAPGWTNKLIMFNSAPLRLVLDEIERQYGIVIETPAEMLQVYSGNFSLDQSVENVLSLLCLPFDLEYERKTGNNYLVYPSVE